MFKNIVSLIVIFFVISCGHGSVSAISTGSSVFSDTVSYEMLGQVKRNVIIIKDTIDLNNRNCIIPSGLILYFEGGYVKNGTLVGNMTQLKSCRPCLKRVSIQGSWNIPIIKSSLFDDLSYDNALKDVVALSNPSIKNKIYIKKGIYKVSALRNNDVCLAINSNTELIIDGTIQLTPNSFRCYNIIQAEGENIIIKGSGTIIGDKHTHTGKDGEWGMGIMLKNAHNIRVTGLTIKDCWGDCMYVGDNSTNVTIDNCLMNQGRRQGISITSAVGVIIQHCEITNVSGIAPEYAIDIEPNKNEMVDNIVIKHVKCMYCKGGFKAVSYDENAIVGSVAIRNCLISAEKFPALKLVRCKSSVVKNNTISCVNKKSLLICKHVNRLKVMNNTLNYECSEIKDLNIIPVKTALGELSEVIEIVNCGNPILSGNKMCRK